MESSSSCRVESATQEDPEEQEAWRASRAAVDHFLLKAVGNLAKMKEDGADWWTMEVARYRVSLEAAEIGNRVLDDWRASRIANLPNKRASKVSPDVGTSKRKVVATQEPVANWGEPPRPGEAMDSVATLQLAILEPAKEQELPTDPGGQPGAPEQLP